MLAFRVIAFRRRCDPTISVTNADREGESTAIEQPVIPATTNTIQASRMVGQHEHREQAVEHGARGLREDEGAVPVVAIGDDAGPGPEQEGGRELEGDREADESHISGQFEHEPVDRDPLHPATDVGEELPDHVEPVVVCPQRDEGVAPARRLGENRDGLRDAFLVHATEIRHGPQGYARRIHSNVESWL